MIVCCYLTDQRDSVMTLCNFRPPQAVVLYPFEGLDPSYIRACSRHSIWGYLKNVMLVFVRFAALSRWRNAVAISKDVPPRFSYSPRTTKIATGRYRNLWLDNLRAWYVPRQECVQWGEENQTDNNGAFYILVSDVRAESQCVLSSIPVQSTSRRTRYMPMFESKGFHTWYKKRQALKIFFSVLIYLLIFCVNNFYTSRNENSCEAFTLC
jgi:hypothetical protein